MEEEKMKRPVNVLPECVKETETQQRYALFILYALAVAVSVSITWSKHSVPGSLSFASLNVPVVFLSCLSLGDSRRIRGLISLPTRILPLSQGKDRKDTGDSLAWNYLERVVKRMLEPETKVGERSDESRVFFQPLFLVPFFSPFLEIIRAKRVCVFSTSCLFFYWIS